MSKLPAEEATKIRLENEMLKEMLEEYMSFLISKMGKEKFDLAMELDAYQKSAESLSKDMEKQAEESDTMKRELEKAMDENRRLAREKEQLISQHQKELEDLQEQLAECQEDKNDLNEEANSSHLEIERLEEKLNETDTRFRVCRQMRRQQKQENLKLVSSMDELFMDNFTLVEKVKNAEAEIKLLKEHNEALVEGYNYLKSFVDGLASPQNPPAENEDEPGAAAQGNDGIDREPEAAALEDALDDEGEEAELVSIPEASKFNVIEEEDGGID